MTPSIFFSSILFPSTAWWVYALLGWLLATTAQAQVLAPEVARSATNASTTHPGTLRQQNWLKASIEQRVKLAEQLGDDGARAFASAKTWTPVFDGTDRGSFQGPDQVYRAADGTVHVIEAKGGSGQLGKGYGHAQGSSEWAVESAKRVLASRTATEAERLGAKAVLEAACQGKLEVVVVRTMHILGEPHVAKLEQTTKCSEKATQLARKALSASAEAAAKVVKSSAELSDDAVRCLDDAVRPLDDVARSADDVARSVDDVTRAASRSGGVIARPLLSGPKLVASGVAVDGVIRVIDGIETERMYEAGQISDRDRVVAHGRNAGGMAGGLAGAYVGVKAGAAAGAAAGTFFCPGIGTAIGVFVGGLTGGIGGYAAGDAVGAGATEAVIDAAYAD